MQKDFMAMAQGQQAPQGATAEQVKANIFEFLQDLNLMPPEGAERQELEQKALELAQLMIEGNEDAIAENPLYQFIVQAMAELETQLGAQQGSAMPGAPGEAPTDFASMMPPTPGGGMGGR